MTAPREALASLWQSTGLPLSGISHSARLASTPARWSRPPERPGTSPPRW